MGDREIRPIRVLVGDERRLLAEALAALIDAMAGFVVTGVLAGGADLDTVAEQEPDLVLMGMAAGSPGALELIRSLQARRLSAAMVLVADNLDPDLIELVLKEHLSGLLLTNLDARDVANCLDQVAHGRAVLPADWQDVLAEGRSDPLAALSRRQLEVLELLAQGSSYAQIAARLFISVNTVKFHVRSIFSELGVANRMAAARVLADRPRTANGPKISPSSQFARRRGESTLITTSHPAGQPRTTRSGR